jgi:hypothetical protein
MKRETFKAARVRLLGELAERGWVVRADLKRPHATSPEGRRLTFKAQAVLDHAGHSLWIDIRGVTVDTLLAFDRPL